MILHQTLLFVKQITTIKSIMITFLFKSNDFCFIINELVSFQPKAGTSSHFVKSEEEGPVDHSAGREDTPPQP